MLPEPVLPEPMLPEPMLPLLEPELGVLGDVGEVVEELPEVPPLAAPEPDLLKCASHSERETCPSLLVSTAEKFGVELLDPALLLPDRPPLAPVAPDELEPDAPEAPEPVLLPDADGVEDEDGEDEDLSLLLEDELCATAALDRANRAAAVAAVNTFNLSIGEPFEG